MLFYRLVPLPELSDEMKRSPQVGLALSQLMRLDDFFHRTLLERYHFDPMRYYHTLEHLVDLFKGLDKLMAEQGEN